MQNSSIKRIYNFWTGFSSVQNAECANEGREDFFFGSEVPSKK